MYIHFEGVGMMRVNYIEDLTKWAEEFTFYSEVRVRFSETDLFGHMNNTVPFAYFEQARIDLFEHYGILMPDLSKKEAERVPIVADLQCDFLRQVFFNEKLKIYVKLVHIGNSSVDIHYMAKNEAGHICFVGRGNIVQITYATGKSAAFTEAEREAMKKI